MNKTEPHKTRPFSLRLTAKERAQLEQRAGNVALGCYIRECLFEQSKKKRHLSRSQFPTKDKQALARVLALLGKSGLGENMTKLAEAARIGALPVSQENENCLREACADIATIKHHVMKALGIQED